jgi:hypothetical protein
MSTKIYYLRDRTVHTHTGKGVPVAAVVTSADKEKRVIRYAIATVHPKDTFVKSRGRSIALGRLDALIADFNQRPMQSRELKLDADVPASGHAITKLVMQDIAAHVDFPVRVQKLASEWIEWSDAFGKNCTNCSCGSKCGTKTTLLDVEADPFPTPRNEIPPPAMS